MLKKRSKDPFAEQKSRRNRYGLAAFRTQLALAVLLVMLFSTVGFYLLQQQDESINARERAEDIAQLFAARIADFVDRIKGFSTAAISNYPIVQMLRRDDQESLRQAGLEIKRLLPPGASIRFFPRDWNQVDAAANPPVSYATLDQMQRVEKTGTPSDMEVHQFNTEQQHLSIALPVMGSTGTAEGVAIVSMPFAVVRQLFSVEGIPGVYRLQQVVNGEGVDLLAIGVDQSGMDGSIAVPGSIWRVMFSGKSVGVEQPMLVGLVLLVATGVLLLILISLLYIRMQKHFKADQVALYHLVEGVSQGRSMTPPQAQVMEMQGAFNLVAQLSQVVGRSLKSGAKIGKEEAVAIPKPEKPEPDINLPLPSQPVAANIGVVHDEIFRAYDIRGVVGQSLTKEIMFDIGRAIGSEAYEQGQQAVIVARDGRESSLQLSQALTDGLLRSGRDVVDIGEMPTPLLYFATHFLGSNSGVVITGSHNPPEYNGLKVVLGGEALTEEGIQRLKERMQSGDLLEGQGSRSEQDLVADYIKRITDDVQLSRPLKVVTDCGNGVAGRVAPQLIDALGCEVIELFSEVDGRFPNHHPDPGQPQNLEQLVATVKQQGADVGLAFDGDGDRLGVVDSNGKIIWADRVLMLLARDVLLRQPGADVVFDVKSTRYLASEILSYGGRPIMWKCGHSRIKAKMRETGALIAGELTGHIFFKERWYGFDDALYAAARLLEVLSAEVVRSAEVFAELPEAVATHELIMPITSDPGEVIEQFAKTANFEGAKMITTDGIRAEFSEGWGLVRASNTTPALVFRFESESEEGLKSLQERFRKPLKTLLPNETLPF